METTAVLDRLESGGTVEATDRIEGIAPAYFERLLGYFGTDNSRLMRLGRHWRDLLPLTDDPAWIYRAGGIYERAQGRWQASAEAFLAAGAHAKTPLDQSAFQVGAIDSLARSGAIQQAQTLATRLRTRLRRLGEPGLAARAMLNLGNVLVYQDRMSEARRALQRALPELELAKLDLEAASARLALSSTHLFGGDPRVAEQMAEDVIQEARALGAEYLADLARLNLAIAYLVTGRADEAHKILLDLRPSMDSSPADSARVEEYLADSLYQLNLWTEAEEAYRQVLANQARLIPLHRANVELGLAQSLLAQGRPGEIGRLLQSANRRYGHLGNRAWQSVTTRLQAMVHLEAGRTKKGFSMLQAAEGLASDSPYHRCQVLLAQSRWGADRVSEAHRLIRKYGYLDSEWQVHYLRARSATQPGTHYRRMFRSVLVSRVGTRSLAARIGFLKDKERALQEYLGWLLARPSPKRTREAISVIEQVRSATLIDEILGQGGLPPHLMETFNRLRQEIGSSLSVAPNGHARLQGAGTVSMSRAQRTVTEALTRLDISGSGLDEGEARSVILAESSSGLHILHEDQALAPLRSATELGGLLQWLPFELLSPMADRGADPEPARKLLMELSDALRPIWEIPNRNVCPEGVFWRIPWSLCGQLAGVEDEWSVAMHPRMDGVFRTPLSRKSRALVWLGQAADLPFSRREAEEIADRFEDCRIVTNVEEARDSLKETVDVIHVVSHAVHRPENPMLSSVEFPDGPLFATEIARSPLNVRLATLSACETGSISIQTRSEPDGLARAFIARGAQSTVASQWPLDDEAAYRQFLALYDAVLGGEDISRALYRSRCICRGWQPHPYYWGALALYSGYSK